MADETKKNRIKRGSGRGVVVKYQNEFNNLNLTKLNPVEHNVFFTLLSTLKNVGENEVSLSFKEFRHKAQIEKNISDDDFYALTTNTLTKVGAGSFVFDSNEKWVMFPLFEHIEVDKKTKELKYSVSKPFLRYFNDFINKFTAFPLIDFVNIKLKYAKNMYRVFMQYSSTGKYTENYDKFVYDILGVPESTPRQNIVSKYIKPNVAYLRKEIPLFKDLEVSFSRNNKTYVGIEFTWTPKNVYEEINQEAIERAEKRRLDKIYQDFSNADKKNKKKKKASYNPDDELPF